MNKDQDICLMGINHQNIDMVWEEIKPYLIKTLEYCDDKYDLDFIYKELKERNMQLWVGNTSKGITAFGITQIINYPTHKRLALLFLGGKDMIKMRWHNLFVPIKDWAKKIGCTAVEGYGRPGWEPFAKELGFKKIHTVYKHTI